MNILKRIDFGMRTNSLDLILLNNNLPDFDRVEIITEHIAQ